MGSLMWFLFIFIQVLLFLLTPRRNIFPEPCCQCPDRKEDILKTHLCPSLWWSDLRK